MCDVSKAISSNMVATVSYVGSKRDSCNHFNPLSYSCFSEMIDCLSHGQSKPFLSPYFLALYTYRYL